MSVFAPGLAPSVNARRLAVAALWALAVALPASAFDLQGHRGTRGLAPENTLAAFRRALDIGVTTLETDVAITRDGVPVIAHDPYVSPNLARDPDGAYVAKKDRLIRSLTLAELKRYDIGRLDPGSEYAKQWPLQTPVDGERYPTLAELLRLIKASGKPVRLNLETKINPERPEDTLPPEEFTRIVIATLRSEDFVARTTLQSFDWRSLAEARRLAPGIATSCLTIVSRNFDNVNGALGRPSLWTAGFDLAKYDHSVPRMVHAAGCGTWSMAWRNLTPADLARAHALGLAVLPWTVNDPADMVRLIDWGVDGIITDYPDRLRKVMADKGMPLP
jgi:glycerophosphoryl diester phosphodiesterase